MPESRTSGVRSRRHFLDNALSMRLRNNQPPLLVNGCMNMYYHKTQLLKFVFSSRYAKHYLKRATGRLETSEDGRTSYERKTSDCE
jgi:hypothetical protein